ncbi:MAG: cytochrome c, partial [Anaerolineae bacterium]
MPTDMRATRVPTGTPAPTATPLPTVTPLPTAPSPPTETPLPAVPYRIAPYSVPGWTGVPRLYIVETVPRQEPV